MTITLSKVALNKDSTGYQAPLPKELVQAVALDDEGNDPLAQELEVRGARTGQIRGG
jgi:hypothetical protein